MLIMTLFQPLAGRFCCRGRQQIRLRHRKHFTGRYAIYYYQCHFCHMSTSNNTTIFPHDEARSPLREHRGDRAVRAKLSRTTYCFKSNFNTRPLRLCNGFKIISAQARRLPATFLLCSAPAAAFSFCFEAMIFLADISTRFQGARGMDISGFLLSGFPRATTRA